MIHSNYILLKLQIRKSCLKFKIFKFLFQLKYSCFGEKFLISFFILNFCNLIKIKHFNFPEKFVLSNKIKYSLNNI